MKKGVLRWQKSFVRDCDRRLTDYCSTENSPLGEGEIKNASLVKGGGPLAVVGLKRWKSAPVKKLEPYYPSALVPSKEIPPTPLYKGGMKVAFTLAEVLITLGIIGVVAAMTLPTLVNNYQKKVLHTQFLKTVSDLNNASKLFEVHEGLSVHEYSGRKTETSASDTLAMFMKYFKGNNALTPVYGGDEYFTLNKQAYKKYLGYIPAALNGKEPSSLPCDSSMSVHDASGRIFVMDGDLVVSTVKNIKGPKICVDINGKKGPNKFGYDWFVFAFRGDGVVEPYIGNSLTNYALDMANPKTYCSYTQNQATYTCAYYAISDTSPLNPSKSYWKDFLK